MSIRVMSQVWATSACKGSYLVILLAIADYANDEGEAWPSVSTLAAKARLGERQTHKILRHLQDSGDLEIRPGAGPYRCNVYRVITSPEGVTGDRVPAVQGVADDGLRVSPATPKPSRNRQGDAPTVVSIESYDSMDTPVGGNSPNFSISKNCDPEEPIPPIKTDCLPAFLAVLHQEYPPMIGGKSLKDIMNKCRGAKGFERTNDKRGYLRDWIERELGWERSNGGVGQRMGGSTGEGQAASDRERRQRAADDLERRIAAHAASTAAETILNAGGKGPARVSA